MILPVVVRDPRFRAGRALIEKGQSEDAIQVFATLLEESQRAHGSDDHLETAAAYYEYGNAIFRSAQKRQQADAELEATAEKSLEDASKMREAAAEAAERRAQANRNDEDGQNKKPSATIVSQKQTPPVKEDLNEEGSLATTKRQSEDKEANGGNGNEHNPESGENDNNSEGDDADHADDDDENDDEIPWALELMETAWAIVDAHQEGAIKSQDNLAIQYREWIAEQVPRILTGIGDVLSALDRHADAADAYLRAQKHRQEALDAMVEKAGGNKESDVLFTVHHLQCRRRLVESIVLVAEELLACPDDKDVVTSESHDVLVKAGERVEYARGYYDKAREELQETVLLMGQLAAKRVDLGDEKENVCFLATMLMGVGERLAEIDEEAAAAAPQTPAKKLKKAK